MTKSKKMIIGTLPFVALIVLFAIFCGIVSSKGYRLDMYIKIVFNEGIVLSIVATGAIFIYTLGSFDISLGAATLFAATLGVMTYNATENIGWMILVIMLAGIGCSLLNSVLASIFHIPVFVTTVAMMSVLSAIASQIITTKGGAVGGISIPSAVVKSLDTSVFKVIVLVVWVAICIFIFNYTKFGRREKFVGGNPVCAQLSGIKYNNYAILGFLMAGIGVGIGAFMTLVYTPSVTTTSPRKTKKVLLEIMGDFPSNERVLESFRTKLSDEGFEVTVYEHENFETARFDVETFKKSYDLVIYIGNVENASNKVTNRLSWYTFWGNGNNVPWFVAERPVVFISLANPYHLVDVPMIKTYINGYSNSEYVIESVMDKLMGRSSFTGKSPVNPFCGKEYLKW